MYPVSIVVCERLESLDDWFGSINWRFLSKMTRSSGSPISSKLAEHKSPTNDSFLGSLSERLFVLDFVGLSLPRRLRLGIGGGQSVRHVGGLRSFLFRGELWALSDVFSLSIKTESDDRSLRLGDMIWWENIWFPRYLVCLPFLFQIDIKVFKAVHILNFLLGRRHAYCTKLIVNNLRMKEVERIFHIPVNFYFDITEISTLRGRRRRSFASKKYIADSLVSLFQRVDKRTFFIKTLFEIPDAAAVMTLMFLPLFNYFVLKIFQEKFNSLCDF